MCKEDCPVVLFEFMDCVSVSGLGDVVAKVIKCTKP